MHFSPKVIRFSSNQSEVKKKGKGIIFFHNFFFFKAVEKTKNKATSFNSWLHFILAALTSSNQRKIPPHITHFH